MDKFFFMVLATVFSTQVFSQNTGPASVGSTDGSSSLKLWLDANQIPDIYDGNNVSVWNDLSGNGTDLIQNGQPNLILNFKNGRAAVRFNGNNEELQGTHSLTGAPITVFSVFLIGKPNQGTDDNDYVYSLGSAISSGRQASLTRRRGNDAGNENKVYSWDGGVAHFAPAIGSQWYISTQFFSSTTPFHSLLLNGSIQTMETDYPSPGLNNLTNEISLGNSTQFSPTFNNRLEGHIAEFFIYDEILNDAKTNIIQNYLSGKYDIAIANDLYLGDANGAGEHDLDIAGVGSEANGSHEVGT